MKGLLKRGVYLFSVSLMWLADQPFVSWSVCVAEIVFAHVTSRHVTWGVTKLVSARVDGGEVLSPSLVVKMGFI